jgi:hypothetical protein
MKKIMYYVAGISLVLAVSFSTAGAGEPVSREEMDALKKEVQEMKALVGELKGIIQQQQGVIIDLKQDVHQAEEVIIDLKKDVHAGEMVAAHEGDDDGHGDDDHDELSLEGLIENIKPNISVTGDMLANLGDDTNMGEDTDRFDLRGVDLTFMGEIDDKAAAVFNFSYHDDDVSLEEGYLDVWNILPYETDLRLGKFRVNFGLLNTIHPHALPQVDYPAIYRTYLGHEGYIDEGVGLAGQFASPWENPFGWSLQVVSGNRHEHGDEDDHGGEDEGDYKRLKDFDDTPFIARLKHRFISSERLSLDWGLSALTGKMEDDGSSPRYYLEGADLAVNWSPFEDRHKRVRWQSEVFFSQIDGYDEHDEDGEEDEHEGGDGSSWGFYSFVDYQFIDKWLVGARYDYAQLPMDNSDRLKEYTAYLTYKHTPNNQLRLQVTQSQPDYARNATEVMLQWVFTLGKHKHLEGEGH